MAQYARPRTLADAVEIRAGGGFTVLAGATDIYPVLTGRRAWGDPSRPDILDISAIDELRGIDEESTAWRLGALTTWTTLRRAVLPPAFAGLQAAAKDVGGAQVQNRGTIAGNLCTASPAGDGIPCLLSLDAEVELASLTGRRRIAVADFVTGYRKTALRPDEIVTAILVPKPEAQARGAFLKLGARRYLVISIAMAAGVIATDDAGSVTRAAIAVGSCGPVARRLPALEAELIGKPLGAVTLTRDHLAPLAPIDDVRATAAYRSEAALGLLRDLVASYQAPAAERAA